MATKMTVELPDELVQHVQADAARTRRSFDAVLADWIFRASKETPLESLNDAEILSICDYDWEKSVQEELSRLSSLAQEGLSGIRVVKAFAREDTQLRRFRLTVHLRLRGEGGLEFVECSQRFRHGSRQTWGFGNLVGILTQATGLIRCEPELPGIFAEFALLCLDAFSSCFVSAQFAGVLGDL